ncbi:hypothetical protein GOBAR_AA38507 [Gossypium barbadense]|uniref:Uncharacterized protein n=1 Tax=Gossypium barbadense TaxID=3634 RepID=A0A2P5VTQ0_GOSBA|nr:hypothetical protein GOBAR_AA38507 [Gossypium barbadense]
MRRRRLRDLSIVQNTPNSEEANSEQQIVIGSSNVSETLNELAEFQISRNSHGQPVGSEARLLSGYLDIIARNANMLPINYESWHHMSDSKRRGRGRMLLNDLYDLNPIKCVKVSRNSHGQPVGSEARLLSGYLDIIARNANMLPINYESWHHMSDSNKNQALDNIKERFVLKVSNDYIKKALGSRSFASIAETEDVSFGQKVGRLQLFEITHRKKDGSPMTSEAGEIMEKLKEKKVEYEAITSTDSSVNLENIDNKIITEVLGPEISQQYMPSGSQAQAEVQRLRDQIAQMQVSTVEQIVEVQ